MVQVVDDDNKVVGAAPRHRVRSENLTHRATYILVLNPRGQLLVQKRTITKDVYPGYWDPCTGGVVLAGESYEQGAERELEEEMGIRGADLVALDDFLFQNGDCRVWGRAFRCLWDGPLRPQPEEVEFVEAMLPAEVLDRSQREPFTPDSLLVVRRYCAIDPV
jgi:isopentenyldiphosphate isomerase